jgi:hypothetical protein
MVIWDAPFLGTSQVDDSGRLVGNPDTIPVVILATPHWSPSVYLSACSSRFHGSNDAVGSATRRRTHRDLYARRGARSLALFFQYYSERSAPLAQRQSAVKKQKFSPEPLTWAAAKIFQPASKAGWLTARAVL